MSQGKIYSKKKYVTAFFIMALVFNMITFTPQAHAWWTVSNIFGSFAQTGMENILEQIKVALLAALKASAVKAINGNVGKLIGGNSTAEALFITDWNEFLYQRPQSQTQVFMNDFFTTVTRGKGQTINYVSSGDAGNPTSGNYASYLVRQADQAIAASDGTDAFAQLGYDLDEFAESPDEIFRKGDMRAFNAFVSNPMNNSFGFVMTATAVHATKMNQAIDAARTEASSSGFIGKKDPGSGKTITPAATIDKMLADTQNIGNNIVAAAENPGIVSTIITAMINRAVNNMIQKGVGKIQASIDREIKKVDMQIGKELDKANKKLGPAAKWLDETSQKTNSVKAYTTPPPNARDNGTYCDGDC